MRLTDSPYPFHLDAPRRLVLIRSLLLGFGLAIAAMEGWEAITRWLAVELVERCQLGHRRRDLDVRRGHLPQL